MHENMRPLLNAFLDGELHGWQLQELQNHLSFCEACRNELRELRLVSNLLHSSPIPVHTPVERFVSQLTLSLPRRAASDLRQKPSSPAWWLVPAGLLGAWFFAQTAFTLTDIVSAARISGILGHASNWFGGGQESIWFSAATNLFGSQAMETLPTLPALNNVSIFVSSLVSGFLWQAAIVFLYWAWLFVWWFRRDLRQVMTYKAS